jgi:Lar family restriction alleviation protein
MGPTPLLPCPFCGSTNISEVEGRTYKWSKMQCNDCEASSGEMRRSEPNAAAIEWNTRETQA